MTNSKLYRLFLGGDGRCQVWTGSGWSYSLEKAQLYAHSYAVGVKRRLVLGGVPASSLHIWLAPFA